MLAVALLVVGCEGPVDPLPEPVSMVLSADSLVLIEGDTDRLAAVVLDARGNEMANPAVAWESSDTAVAVVNDAGVVSAVRPGLTQVTATVSRTNGGVSFASAAVRVRSSLVLTLEPDSLVLPAPGCGQTLFARIRTHAGEELTALTPEFTLTDPEVVSLHGLMIPGTYRGQTRSVHAERVGTTRVIAAHGSAADTAEVSVVSDAVQRFYLALLAEGATAPARWEMAAEDTLRLHPRAEYARCAPDATAGPRVPGVEPQYRSLDETVATVSAAGVVTARAPGQAAIVAEWREFADTLQIEVKGFRIEPADTLVAVGDTVRYRAWVIEADGTEREVAIGGIGTSDSAIAATTLLPGNVPAAIARSPGSVQIGAYVLSRFRYVRLQVQDASGG